MVGSLTGLPSAPTLPSAGVVGGITILGIGKAAFGVAPALIKAL